MQVASGECGKTQDPWGKRKTPVPKLILFFFQCKYADFTHMGWESLLGRSLCHEPAISGPWTMGVTHKKTRNKGARKFRCRRTLCAEEIHEIKDIKRNNATKRTKQGQLWQVQEDWTKLETVLTITCKNKFKWKVKWHLMPLWLYDVHGGCLETA